MQACPCGQLGPGPQALTYGQCCGPYLDDFTHTPAPNAQALMRSRYTAFVLQREAYLLATWHSSRRPTRLSFDAGVKWLGLEVRDHQQLDDSHAEVEFVARQRDKTGRAVRLHERSRFVREDEGAGLRWYYLEGDWR